MVVFTPSDELQEARFVGANLRGARFVESDLSGAVMRGVQAEDIDIDAPWIVPGESFVRINGVDVMPFVEDQLNLRFPGRAERRAADPDGLRAAWAALERIWAASLERVAAMPPGTENVSVAGEWSFKQTLRHLIFATDMWLRQGILQLDQPFHPIGLAESSQDDSDAPSTSEDPSYAEVLQVRESRVAMVRDFIGSVTPDELARQRPNPHEPQYLETTLSCLHVILEEEWEHHRYAVRDLDAIAADVAVGAAVGPS